MLLRTFIIALAVMAVGGCSSIKSIPFEGTTLTQPRQQLTVDQLQEPATSHVLDMSYLAKPNWGQKATDRFSGSFTFVETKMITPIDDSDWHGSGQTLFPSFSVDFVSDDDVLTPRYKGIISTRQKGKSYWNVIVGTGNIWKEADDQEWNRASFPLTLVSRQVGQVRNCVGTFIYNQKKVSRIYVQCSQETSPIDDYQPGDMLVYLSAEYQPKIFDDTTNIIQQYYKTITTRLPVYPLDEIDKDKLAYLFDKRKASNAPTSLGALVIDEKIYLHPPKTRHGIYPYPHEMRHGVFSVTKSLVGGLSMFYLAQRYGEAIFDERITDYVPLLPNHPGWQSVTFSNALNMVTGTEGGEEGALIVPFILTSTADEGIKKISELKNSSEAPGEEFNYASTNTFVLSYAMQKYVEKKEGKGTYYWDLVRENVLKPINAESLALQHTEEIDGSKGIPLLAWGAFPTIDETAKIASLLLNEGRHRGKQLLHGGKIREALNRTEWTGYPAPDGKHYNHSFWSHNISSANCDLKVSYMLGYGGNYVTFLPSNVIIIRFMDENDYYIDPLVHAVEKIKTSCK